MCTSEGLGGETGPVSGLRAGGRLSLPRREDVGWAGDLPRPSLPAQSSPRPLLSDLSFSGPLPPPSSPQPTLVPCLHHTSSQVFPQAMALGRALADCSQSWSCTCALESSRSYVVGSYLCPSSTAARPLLRLHCPRQPARDACSLDHRAEPKAGAQEPTPLAQQEPCSQHGLFSVPSGTSVCLTAISTEHLRLPHSNPALPRPPSALGVLTELAALSPPLSSDLRLALRIEPSAL